MWPSRQGSTGRSTVGAGRRSTATNAATNAAGSRRTIECRAYLNRRGITVWRVAAAKGPSSVVAICKRHDAQQHTGGGSDARSG
ncbi:hypothetical protein GCM10010464_29140 [Pseudonocardia yunnanensis]